MKAVIHSMAFRLLMVVLLATAAVFYWSSTQHKAADHSDHTWVDDVGQLHVLGVVLGQYSLREAERALKSRSDIALYIYPEGHPRAGITLEAFFPSIADHSKVILELDASMEVLHQLQQHSTLPHLYPNQVLRMNLHPEDLVMVQQLLVKQVTLIPSLQITEQMLRKRFGEPNRSVVDAEQTRHDYFDAIGLYAQTPMDDLTQLRFKNPAP